MRPKVIENGQRLYRQIPDTHTYPQLKRGISSGVVVLFTAPKAGKVVDSGRTNFHEEGYYSDIWLERGFECVEEVT